MILQMKLLMGTRQVMTLLRKAWKCKQFESRVDQEAFAKRMQGMMALESVIASQQSTGLEVIASQQSTGLEMIASQQSTGLVDREVDVGDQEQPGLRKI